MKEGSFADLVLAQSLTRGESRGLISIGAQNPLCFHIRVCTTVTFKVFGVIVVLTIRIIRSWKSELITLMSCRGVALTYLKHDLFAAQIVGCRMSPYKILGVIRTKFVENWTIFLPAQPHKLGFGGSNVWLNRSGSRQQAGSTTVFSFFKLAGSSVVTGFEGH